MLLIPSLTNFRDAGGARTADGLEVRTGRLYRSNSLAGLPDEDLERLGVLGIRTVIDLRRPSEVEKYGRVADAAGRRYLNISPEHAQWEEVEYDESLGPVRFITERYLELAETGIKQFGIALATLADAETVPAVVHCYAGKDRTGILVALVLALVGVPDDAIADDYARSGDWWRTLPDVTEPPHWAIAPREAMVGYLAAFRERYGTPEAYALAAGVSPAEIAALRATFLS